MRTACSLTDRILWCQVGGACVACTPRPCTPPSHPCPPQPCMFPRHAHPPAMNAPQAHKPPSHTCPLAMHAPQPCMPPGHAHPIRHTHPLGMHPPDMHAPSPGTHTPYGAHMPPLWTEWQTGVKKLPCPKLRLRAVNIYSKLCAATENWTSNTWSISLLPLWHQTKVIHLSTVHIVH